VVLWGGYVFHRAGPGGANAFSAGRNPGMSILTYDGIRLVLNLDDWGYLINHQRLEFLMLIDAGPLMK